MFNEIFFLEILSIITLFFFNSVTNIVTLWYLAGIYLFNLGFLLLLDDGDIFVGFLWVIDLGVGLIFFIFILHFSNFLYQKPSLNLTDKFLYFFIFLLIFLFIFLFFFSSPSDSNFNYDLQKTWFFYISFYDFYDFFFVNVTSDLNLLREIYFFNNSFGFFLINFMIFYGIIASINLSFLIKRVFSFLTYGQFKNFKLLNEPNSVFFIRNQNFIKQQNTSVGTRVWLKKKVNQINDF